MLKAARHPRALGAPRKVTSLSTTQDQMETEDQHTPETALRERSRFRSSLDADKAALGATGRGTSSAGCPPIPVPVPAPALAPATANLAPTRMSTLSRSYFIENWGGFLPETPGIELKKF